MLRYDVKYAAVDDVRGASHRGLVLADLYIYMFLLVFILRKYGKCALSYLVKQGERQLAIVGHVVGLHVFRCYDNVGQHAAEAVLDRYISCLDDVPPEVHVPQHDQHLLDGPRASLVITL